MTEGKKDGWPISNVGHDEKKERCAADGGEICEVYYLQSGCFDVDMCRIA
jgi:hypothetical protein